MTSGMKSGLTSIPTIKKEKFDLDLDILDVKEVEEVEEIGEGSTISAVSGFSGGGLGNSSNTNTNKLHTRWWADAMKNKRPASPGVIPSIEVETEKTTTVTAVKKGSMIKPNSNVKLNVSDSFIQSEAKKLTSPPTSPTTSMNEIPPPSSAPANTATNTTTTTSTPNGTNQNNNETVAAVP